MSSWCRPLVVLCLLSLAAASTAPAAEDAKTALAPRHLMLVGAARELAAEVCERVWPGWCATPMEILLVAGEREFLLGSSRSPAGFESLGEVFGVGAVLARPRALPPTLLATMPLLGPPPTLVVGTPEATGRHGTAWLQVILHEHFHQWQMRSPDYYEESAALDLADGDTTGRWMLEYPFPYEEPSFAEGWAAASRALARVLRRASDDDVTVQAAGFWADFARLTGSLAPRDRRYLDFQLWQEGVARFVELRVAQEAAAHWSPPRALAAEADFEDFGTVARAAEEDLLTQLDAPDLAAGRRVSFYAMGAGLAMLLDRTEPDWKQRYESPRFLLAPSAPSD